MAAFGSFAVAFGAILFVDRIGGEIAGIWVVVVRGGEWA